MGNLLSPVREVHPGNHLSPRIILGGGQSARGYPPAYRIVADPEEASCVIYPILRHNNDVITAFAEDFVNEPFLFPMHRPYGSPTFH